jgi:hypothetical protein
VEVSHGLERGEMETTIDSKVLDAKVHGRLIADLRRIARRANVAPRAITTPMAEVCSPAEVEWVKGLREHMREGIAGLMLVGNPERIEERMAAIAGACIRNFVDARVMSLQEVLAHMKAGDMPKPTVLLVPNFFVPYEKGGSVAKWEVSALLGLLMDRYSAGVLTIVYVDNVPLLGREYGPMIREHLLNYYDKHEA